MGIIIRIGNGKRMMFSSYLTQENQELKTRVILKSLKRDRDGSRWLEDDRFFLHEKDTKKLTNYLVSMLYQLGEIDELDIIKKNKDYHISDKSQNKDYVKSKSAKEYKNPFKIVD